MTSLNNPKSNSFLPDHNYDRVTTSNYVFKWSKIFIVWPESEFHSIDILMTYPTSCMTISWLYNDIIMTSLNDVPNKSCIVRPESDLNTTSYWRLQMTPKSHFLHDHFLTILRRHVDVFRWPKKSLIVRPESDLNVTS